MVQRSQNVRMMQDVIDECKKNDIILVLNLHHFDLPIELFQKYGGWEIYPKAIYDIAKILISKNR